MILIGAAKQTSFFYQIGNDVGFWGEMGVVCGLIGFAILVFSFVFQKSSMKDFFFWVAILLTVIIIPSFWSEDGMGKSDPLFFHELVPNTIDWVNSPYPLVPNGQPLPGGRTPEDEIETAGVDIRSALKIWTPQIVAIDVLNRLRAEMAVSFDKDANSNLAGDIAAIQMMRRTQMLDYRPHFDMATFLSMCGSQVANIRNADIWLTEEELRAADSPLLAELRAANFNVGHLITGQKLYWAERQRLTERAEAVDCDAEPDSPEAVRACRDIQTLGLPPLGVVSSRGSSSSLRGAAARRASRGQGSSTSVTSAELINELITAKHTILVSETGLIDSAPAEIWAPFQNNAVQQQREFDHFLNELGTRDEVTQQRILSTPVQLVMARMNDSGNVDPDGNWFTRPKQSNCLELHERTVASFEEARDNYLAEAENLEALLNRYAPSSEGRTAADIPSHVRATIAYAALEERLAECERTRRRGGCVQSIRDKADLDRLMLSAAMTNAQPEVDAILNRAMTTEGSFGSPIRELASQFGSTFSPVAIFFKGLFGGFEAGTYAAIMPMLISYFLTLIIMCTPLIMLVGLVAPSYAPGTFLAPIILVVYLKTVEISFVLVKGVFGLLLAMSDKYSGLVPGQLTSFHDIILGSAYTAAFMISLVLLFGLKDPGKLVQQIAGKADSVAQISSAEALAMAGSAVGVAKTAGAFLIPGGAGLKALGALGGAAQNMSSPQGEGYLGGLMNTIDEGRAGALGQISKRQGISAELANQFPQSAEDQAMRARARSYKRVDDESMEYAKGAGVSGGWRAERGYQETVGNVTNNRKLDAPLTVVAEAIGKGSPEELERHYKVAVELQNKGVMRLTRDDSGVQRVEIVESKINHQLPRHLHQALDRIKSESGFVNRKDQDGKTFKSISE